jgi:hypothetical protein
MTVKMGLIKPSKSSTQVLIVRIQVNYINKIDNSSLYSNLISLPTQKSGKIQEEMCMKHPAATSNYLRREILA